MELVEGEDLSRRIARGAIPIDEALPIAKQVAEALEGAHEQGIIHRDLKPANIKVRSDGTVKVLDFGLAKAIERAGEAGGAAGVYRPDFPDQPDRPDLAASPTITSPAMLTGIGVILGTAAYMSPEQARGRVVDKRADIWAFGCVLYEMLTGQPAFPGENVTDTLAAVVRAEPDWRLMPREVSPSLTAFLRRCFEKEPKRRLRDIGDVRLALDGAFDIAARGTVGQMDGYRWQPITRFGAAAAITTGVLVGTAVWVTTRQPAPAAPRVTRVQMGFPPVSAPTIDGITPDQAMTPDGSRLVYVGNNSTQLFVRALDTLEPVAVLAGSAMHVPFVSPDGQWIGLADNFLLKKIAVNGGPVVTLATLDGNLRGATWAPNGTIILATSNTTTGLQRLAAAGGPTTVVTRPDRAQGEGDHLWPEMLPGGRAVLFTITRLSGSSDDTAQVAVLDLQTGTYRVLVRGGNFAHYLPSGHLIYGAGGTLRAVPFDPIALQLRGSSVPVVPDVLTTNGLPAMAAVSGGNGTLVYASGGLGGQRLLLWVDREGRETPIAAPPRAYFYPRLSADGARIAVGSLDEQNDIWVWDVGPKRLTRVTFEPGVDSFPVWTPDSRRLMFSSERTGARNLFWQAADGTGAIDRLTESANNQITSAVSPDGRFLLFTEVAATTGEDLMQVTLAGTHSVQPLVQSSSAERNAIVSPDGQWLAYEANNSGRFEVYVRPYPDVNRGRWQVSTSGGTQPLWGRNGRELFFVSAGAILRVGVAPGSSWSPTAPTTLIKEGYHTTPGANSGRMYDVTADGQRFLMIKDVGTGAAYQVVLVQHWFEELRRLAPVK